MIAKEILLLAGLKAIRIILGVTILCVLIGMIKVSLDYLILPNLQKGYEYIQEVPFEQDPSTHLLYTIAFIYLMSKMLNIGIEIIGTINNIINL